MMMDHDEMMDAMYEETVDYDDEAFIQECVEFYRGDYDCDEYEGGWDDLETGFDPYMGCYTDDC